MSSEFAQCKDFCCSEKINFTVPKLREDEDHLSRAVVMENAPLFQDLQPTAWHFSLNHRGRGVCLSLVVIWQVCL